MDPFYLICAFRAPFVEITGVASKPKLPLQTELLYLSFVFLKAKKTPTIPINTPNRATGRSAILPNIVLFNSSLAQQSKIPKSTSTMPFICSFITISFTKKNLLLLNTCMYFIMQANYFQCMVKMPEILSCKSTIHIGQSNKKDEGNGLIG